MEQLTKEEHNFLRSVLIGEFVSYKTEDDVDTGEFCNERKMLKLIMEKLYLTSERIV